jgi:hypothetical protein
MLPVVALVVALGGSAGANPILIECENYIASHNEGGTSISVTACSGASQGKAVEGFDTPGDWIEVIWDLDTNGAFTDRLRSAGDDGVESEIRATMSGADPLGGDIASAFQTYGYGIG